MIDLKKPIKNFPPVKGGAISRGYQSTNVFFFKMLEMEREGRTTLDQKLSSMDRKLGAISERIDLALE